MKKDCGIPKRIENKMNGEMSKYYLISGKSISQENAYQILYEFPLEMAAHYGKETAMKWIYYAIECGLHDLEPEITHIRKGIEEGKYLTSDEIWEKRAIFYDGP